MTQFLGYTETLNWILETEDQTYKTVKDHTSAAWGSTLSFGATGATVSWRTKVSIVSWWPLYTWKSWTSWLSLRGGQKRRDTLLSSSHTWLKT